MIIDSVPLILLGQVVLELLVFCPFLLFPFSNKGALSTRKFCDVDDLLMCLHHQQVQTPLFDLHGESML